MRAHQSVMNFAVDWKLLRMGIPQTVFLGARQHEFRRLVELGGSRYAVQTRQAAQVFVRRKPARFVADRRPLCSAEKGLLGEEQGTVKNQAGANSKPTTWNGEGTQHRLAIVTRRGVMSPYPYASDRFFL